MAVALAYGSKFVSGQPSGVVAEDVAARERALYHPYHDHDGHHRDLCGRGNFPEAVRNC
ncbi:hypothetical protein VXQ18_15940 [Brucella abortus]|nr:hypothetical protein [Brucella abortus]